MTPRERMLRTLDWRQPDRLPVIYHASPAGLWVHGQKLLDLFRRLEPDTPIEFNELPQPPAGTLDPSGNYHEFKTDDWGVEWEYRIFGLWGHPHHYPLRSWHEAGDFIFPQLRLVPDEPERRKKLREKYFLMAGGIQTFERLHSLRPFNEVLVDVFSEDQDLLNFLDRMIDYQQDLIAQQLQAGADIIQFGDDWGMQQAPLISPKLFRKIFKPYYQRMFEQVKKGGAWVMFHSCGFLGEIYYELADLGIDILWPQIALYYQDMEVVRYCRRQRVALYIHPDRQYLMPRGTPDEIDKTVKGYADEYRALGGGGIFYVEIENDAPWENVKTLIEAIHRYR